MKLIIDIPEDTHERITRPDRLFTDDDVNKICWAVYNGAPIPDNATVCDIDAIKAEIDKQAWAIAISDTDRANGMWDAYRIIDKYRG